MIIINQNCYQPMRQARIEQGLTQRELGQKAGIPYASIKGYERGRNRPPLRRLDKIARALGVDMEFTVPQRPSIHERNELLKEFMELPGYIIRDNWPLVAATHMEIEDLTQELLLRALLAIETYDPNAGASLRTHVNIAMKYHLMKLARDAAARGMTDVPKGVRITFCSVEAMLDAGFEFEG